MGRPPSTSTPTEVRECEIHGLVEFRQHKVGIDPRTHKQKVRWRCPQCHAAKQH